VRLFFKLAVGTSAALCVFVAGLVECMVRPLSVVCHGCKVQSPICC
jgi:hypothetical protein